MIKAEAYHRPIRVPSAKTEQRSKTGLHYMTATGTESNWILLLLWAHPLMGLCIKQTIIIARMMLVSVERLWPSPRITEGGSMFFYFLFSNNTFKLVLSLLLLAWITRRRSWDASYIMNAATTLKVTADTAEQLLLLQWHHLSHLIQTHYLMDEANFVKSLQCCAWAWCKTQENKIYAKVDYRLLWALVPQIPLMWHSVWCLVVFLVSSEPGVQGRFQQGHTNCKITKFVDTG